MISYNFVRRGVNGLGTPSPESFTLVGMSSVRVSSEGHGRARKSLSFS